MTDRMTDTSSDPVREILEHWKAAFDGHQVETMAGLFTKCLRGHPGLQAGEESDPCGAGQETGFRPQGERPPT
ncbi:hypothetical protein ACWDA7_43285 [Streptomyces sp. NPDC001156]